MNRSRDNANFDRREVEAALAKILGDAQFRKNTNSANFLKFVVEEALDGRGDRLKGFTIATSALGRHPDFDPQSSSAVRVQAKRLRSLLEEYYRGPGSQQTIRVVLSPGSYQPRFERRPAAEPVARPIDPPKTNRSSRGLRGASLSRVAGIAAVACLVIASAALLVRLSTPAKIAVDGEPYPRPPIVVVESANDVGATKDARDVTEAAVVAAQSKLSIFDHFVIERRAETKSPNRPDYTLSVHAGPSGGAINDFTFQLVYLRTNEIVWSRTFPGVNLGYPATIRDMIQTVLVAVGDIYGGAVIADQRRRAAQSSAPPRGYFCLLEAYDYVLNRSLERRALARECVEHEFAAHPRDPRVLTWITGVLFRDYMDLQPGNKGFADMERAEALAQRAFESSPHRMEASFMLFVTRFYARHFDDAFEIAHQLFEEFPNSRILAATVGMAYLSRGRYDEGVALLSRLEGPNSEPPNLAVPALAFAAYLRGDEATAGRFARLAASARYPTGLVLRIAVCAKEKNQGCVQGASQQLRRDYPGFAADVATGFDRLALTDDIKAKLLSDLRTAGFFDETSM